MNFKEPATTFAYNLISLHHDVMWYIILIICLVYWVLYKILKDFLWSVFNKQEGFLSILYNYKFLWNLQVYIILTSYIFYRRTIKYYFEIVQKIINVGESFALNFKGYYVVNLFTFFLGDQYFKYFRKGESKESESEESKIDIDIDIEKKFTIIELIENKRNWVDIDKFKKQELYDISFHKIWWNYVEESYIRDLLIERFFANYMYNKTTNGLYYNDRKISGIAYLNTLKFKHSFKLEYIFGMFPTVIIWYIIVPSMYLLYSNESEIDPNLTIKIIGHQWYWTYQARSAMDVKGSRKALVIDYNYDSVMVDVKKLSRGGKRLLETDTALVLPYNMIIRFLITSADVLHSWALPEFGIKVDAVPGRLNQVVTSTNNLGIFYGQCSELCGVSHGFMPIKVNVITMKDYYYLFLGGKVGLKK